MKQAHVWQGDKCVERHYEAVIFRDGGSDGNPRLASKKRARTWAPSIGANERPYLFQDDYLEKFRANDFTYLGALVIQVEGLRLAAQDLVAHGFVLSRGSTLFACLPCE